VLDAYIATKFPKHTSTYKYLRQAILERRVLVLLDGFDEAGSKQSLAEEFLRDQLLGQGFAVLFSSRYTGFDAARLSAQFTQYEIKDLSFLQHEKMANSQLAQQQAEVFLAAFRHKAAEDVAFEEVGASVHTYSMLVALFKRDGRFCSSKGELYKMILTGASDRLDEAHKQFVMDGSKVEFFRSLSLQSHIRTQQLRNISLKSIREWRLPEDMWVIVNEAERAGRLPFWEPADEDPLVKEYRFAQITYQEYFVADVLVSEFVSKGTGIAGLLKHAGEPIELFGIVKWHNILKFAVELLELQGRAVVTEFANHILGASTVGVVSGEMGVPGAAALQPLLVACTLEQIALDVSGSGVLKDAKASSVLADGLKRNTTFTSMQLQGIHGSGVSDVLSSHKVLSILDISKIELGVKELAHVAEALELNT
jgi:hypothetical protein